MTATIAPGLLWPAEMPAWLETVKGMRDTWSGTPDGWPGALSSSSLEAAIDAAAATFARANGWDVRRRPFSLDMLRRASPWPRRRDRFDFPDTFDHPQFFARRTPGERVSRPVALVVHAYDPGTVPTARGLRCDPLPASWYSPGELRGWVIRRQAEGRL